MSEDDLRRKLDEKLLEVIETLPAIAANAQACKEGIERLEKESVRQWGAISRNRDIATVGKWIFGTGATGAIAGIVKFWPHIKEVFK